MNFLIHLIEFCRAIFPLVAKVWLLFGMLLCHSETTLAVYSVGFILCTLLRKEGK